MIVSEIIKRDTDFEIRGIARSGKQVVAVVSGGASDARSVAEQFAASMDAQGSKTEAQIIDAYAGKPIAQAELVVEIVSAKDGDK